MKKFHELGMVAGLLGALGVHSPQEETEARRQPTPESVATPVPFDPPETTEEVNPDVTKKTPDTDLHYSQK